MQDKDFQLLESILWRPRRGFYLLRRHMVRLSRTADFFGFHAVPAVDLRRILDHAVADARPDQASKVRLLVDSAGRCTIQIVPLTDTDKGCRAWLVRPARRPVDGDDCFLRHKTTCRKVYDRARVGRTGCDDVILWNQRREVTETTIANLVFDFGDGQLVTPAASCGLLPGVYRELLLTRGRISEAVVSLDVVLACRPKLYLINSVRRWVPAVLV